MSATSHADAKARKQRAQDSLDSVHAGKRQAALKSAGTDTSAANAQRVKRERWSDGSLGGQHTPGQ